MERKDIIVVLFAVILSVLIVGLVSWKVIPKLSVSVGTVDLESLIVAKQTALSATPGLDSRKILEESGAFGQRLTIAVEKIGAECRCVLLNKAAVLGGNSIDYTDEVRTLADAKK
jgi:hypothetical protein